MIIKTRTEPTWSVSFPSPRLPPPPAGPSSVWTWGVKTPRPHRRPPAWAGFPRPPAPLCSSPSASSGRSGLLSSSESWRAWCPSHSGTTTNESCRWIKENCHAAAVWRATSLKEGDPDPVIWHVSKSSFSFYNFLFTQEKEGAITILATLALGPLTSPPGTLGRTLTSVSGTVLFSWKLTLYGSAHCRIFRASSYLTFSK